MKKIIPYILVTCVLFCFACDSGKTTSTNNTDTKVKTTTTNADHTAPSDDAELTTSETEKTAPTSVAPFDKGKVLAWVDKLNIRAEPNLKSEVIATAIENESLSLTGAKSDHTETLELRGKSYTEPWVQVKTAKGTIGWVFGGTIKKTGETKGNALNTSTQFIYPHFGAFNLSEWKKTGTRDDGGEESDATTTIYKKGNQTLEITDSSMGEFYWGKGFKLIDANNKVLKERMIDISSCAEAGHTLTEMVKDYTSKPAKEYTRSNILKTHFYNLNPKPDMAKGDWKIKTLEDS